MSVLAVIDCVTCKHWLQPVLSWIMWSELVCLAWSEMCDMSSSVTPVIIWAGLDNLCLAGMPGVITHEKRFVCWCGAQLTPVNAWNASSERFLHQRPSKPCTLSVLFSIARQQHQQVTNGAHCGNMKDSIASLPSETIWTARTNYAWDVRHLFKCRIANLFVSFSSLNSYVEVNYTGLWKSMSERIPLKYIRNMRICLTQLTMTDNDWNDWHQ